MFVKLEFALEFPGGFAKTQIPRLSLRVSDPVSVDWGLSICIFNNFPGNAEATCQEPHFENVWVRTL